MNRPRDERVRSPRMNTPLCVAAVGQVKHRAMSFTVEEGDDVNSGNLIRVSVTPAGG